MDRPLDEPYFNWLFAKVLINDEHSQSYMDLLAILYNTEFVWVELGDDNRAGDGLDLRIEFLRESRLENDEAWYNVGCSVLEMLIALARRAEWQSDISTPEWFWKFITNLNLAEYNREGLEINDNVYSIIDNFLWRTYEYDGRGGLFPLKNPREDQRKVEIWYQFSAYLAEHVEIGL